MADPRSQGTGPKARDPPQPDPSSAQPVHPTADAAGISIGLVQVWGIPVAAAEATSFPFCSFMPLCRLGQQRSSQFPVCHHVRGDRVRKMTVLASGLMAGVPQNPKTMGLCHLAERKGLCFRKQRPLPLGRLGSSRPGQGRLAMLPWASQPPLPPAPVQGKGAMGPAMGRGAESKNINL